MSSKYLYNNTALKNYLKHKDDHVGESTRDILEKEHKFLREDVEEAERDGQTASGSNWKSRVAKKYYDKLYREFCLVDLSKYKQNSVAMRWRTEEEVKSGKGETLCGNLYCFDKTNKTLNVFEVPFAYIEDDEQKQALVKLTLCDVCSPKLSYSANKKMEKERRKEKKEKKKRRREDKEEVMGSMNGERGVGVSGDSKRKQRRKDEKLAEVEASSI